MKKITSMIASALLLMGLSANAQITSPVMSTGKLLTAEELNASTGTKRIAIQLAHSGTEYGYWYTIEGETYHSSPEFNANATFEWIKSGEKHILKQVSKQMYCGTSNPHELVAEKAAQLLYAVKPASSGTNETAANIDANVNKANPENYCRFVRAEGGNWINVSKNEYNNGTGVWTIFYVYDLTDHVDGQVTFSPYEGAAIKGLAADDKLTTFSSPVATKIPEGVRAFYVETASTGDQVAILKEITGNIPANQGVILVSKKATAIMTQADGNVAAFPASALKGSGNRYTKDPITSQYVLATNGGVTQFYRTSGKLAPNKAYLELAASGTTVSLSFPGEATAIEAVKAEANENAPVYDLTGRKVNDTVKGNVYIQNGKKFIVK